MFILVERVLAQRQSEAYANVKSAPLRGKSPRRSVDDRIVCSDRGVFGLCLRHGTQTITSCMTHVASHD